MRVLVAGGTGVIGRRLVPLLLGAGHEVTGTTRRETAASWLREAGARAVVCDLLEPGAAERVVHEARPDVIVDELSSLAPDYDPRRAAAYAATNRIRRDGTGALLAAAAASDTVRRYLVQSLAFLYAPEGSALKDEDARPWTDAPEPFGSSVAIVLENERLVTSTPGIEGLVLRYGFFYGPDTFYASDGSIAARVRARRYPVIGAGRGCNPYVTTLDAAIATACAVERGRPGIYNVVDDEPAPMHAWLPAYAEAIGAKPPHRVPAWLARLLAGRVVTTTATELRGVSNAKAKRELGWSPVVPSWREGFAHYLDRDPSTAAR
jgi:nucleoside-diphosphate-sugar epimerase